MSDSGQMIHSDYLARVALPRGEDALTGGPGENGADAALP